MATQAEHVQHPIAPVFDERSRVLLLGSFPSPKSRELGFFYAHPQNRMWRVLAAVAGEDGAPQTTPQRRAFLLRHGIAMYDVIACCRISGASDASIADAVPTDLSPLLSASPIQAVFTTGAKATQLYERHQLARTGLPATRLPSTSAANAAWGLDALVAAYRAALGPYVL